MANTTHQNLPQIDEGEENAYLDVNDANDKMEIGRALKIGTPFYGENVAQYDPICVTEADDKYYKADANNALLQDIVGIATAARNSGQDGYVYSNGAIVTNGGWTWTLDAPVFLTDAKGLAQTPGTNPIIIGIVLAPTMLLINIIHLNFQLAHLVDYTVTATTPGTGADATTWTGAQCTAAYNDIVGLQAEVTLLHARLELLKISATA